ncbi:MAG: hypothetical protein HOV79_02100 [Hamadaea sp.]|nr:hypothetical protein [Hamadaea sp.]
MTSSRLLPTVVLTALTTLALAACSGNTPKLPTNSPAPATSPSAAASPTQAAVAYKYVDLDLCEMTDVAPLSSLKLTLKSKKRSVPLGYTKGQAESCLREFTTADGHVARLTVEAIPAKSTDAAEAVYAAAAQGMQVDGPVTGAWEQGEAATLNTTEGSKQAQYLIHVRTGNLHLKVWLAVGGDSYVAKDKLAGPAKAFTDAAYKTVAQHWKA